jgi:signal transduction histidine kinase/ActR/RegA family two-component response regulator
LESVDNDKLRKAEARLEIFSELNQLIGSGVSLERIVRTLSRQLAFRFSADVSLILLLTESGDVLEVKGGFGYSDQNKRVPILNNALGRLLRLGGMMSIPDLSHNTDHGFEFLLQNGISSVLCCSIEARAETLGIILIGYKRPTNYEEEITEMFAEFCQGASAAIMNARSQARLTAYAERLEELVQQRTVDLANQKELAEESNRAKSRFVANMSHELRTPLTAIVGYASVLRDGVFGAVNEKQFDALQSIFKSSEHLKELIDEVLNLSRIEAGKEDPEPSKVELYSLLQQCYKLVIQNAASKGVKILPLTIADSIKTEKLWVDPRHIRQILLNLLSNAIKYTPTEGSVGLEANVCGDKMQISVKDTGVGLSASDKEKLFQRFERGDDSYSRDQIGTGLGLSLTKHLVAINGGHISVESEKGIGSTFSILIPIAECSGVKAEDTNQENALDIRLDGLNILVCDDNLLTRDVLQILIHRYGGIPFLAESVKEARGLIENNQFDLSIVDLAMPGEDGFKLMDFIRNYPNQAVSKMPILVVTACVFEEDKNNAFKHGASAFVPKPFVMDEVVTRIRELSIQSALKV